MGPLKNGVDTCVGLFSRGPVKDGGEGGDVTSTGSEKYTTTLVTITCISNRLVRMTQMVDVGITIRAPGGEGVG